MTDEPIDVLLVEDNPGDVHLVQEAFDESDRESALHTVTDGVEALDFLRRRGDYADAPRPGIVLLDLNLPRKSGYEVLEEMKDDPDLRHVPTIVLTSSRSNGEVAKSYDRHANAHLTKPVDPFEFIEKIQQFEELWLSTVRLPESEE